MKEELYKWYPIVDEGEYWMDDELSPKIDPTTLKRIYKDDIVTVVTNGEYIMTKDGCIFSWSTMAKMGDWKYMRIKLD